MFENIEKQQKKIATQKKVRGRIIKKKAGRPKQPHKIKRQFKVPADLYAEMQAKADSLGMNYSSFICESMREKLNKS